MVDHEAESAGQAQFAGHRAGGEQKMSQHGLVIRGGLATRGIGFLGTMSRCTGACGWMSWMTTH